MDPPFIFVKKWIYKRYNVDVIDDITTTKGIRRANDKMFSVLILLCQQVTNKQNNLRRKTCLIIVTDVKMTSKRAILQKVTVLLMTEKKVLLE